jgi:hypothetical protein
MREGSRQQNQEVGLEEGQDMGLTLCKNMWGLVV